MPDDLVGLAWQAKQNFDGGKYRTAEKQYQEILTKSPNNLYSISNLGVVYFRTGKLKAAELMLKKAVAISPKDEFSHTTLGIVYYRQSKFDEALTELTKSLAINPKSATAHNYLGITASQKGWQEAAAERDARGDREQSRLRRRAFQSRRDLRHCTAAGQRTGQTLLREGQGAGRRARRHPRKIAALATSSRGSFAFCHSEPESRNLSLTA